MLTPAAEDLSLWRAAVEERYGPQPGHGLILQWLDHEAGQYGTATAARRHGHAGSGAAGASGCGVRPHGSPLAQTTP
jgi:hypothetical protein